MSTELLVLLSGERGIDDLQALTGSLRVTQVGSPRIAIVEAPADAAERLRSTHGVAAVAAPGEALAGDGALTEQERLFADAWSQRTSGTPAKARAGDGLAWDAPGFSPPDPPESER